ncbi:MAG: enoyl-CoA hydratase-related protein [Bacillota bacterium]
MAHIRIERYDDGIAELTIDRPEALNALNQQVLEELASTLAGLADDPDLRCLIITGAGRAFVAGADIAAMAEMTQEEAEAFSRLGSSTFTAVEQLPVPVIAAVNGYALGGGCELALACDFRYASEKARFGQPEVGLGIIPGFGGTQRLPRLIGAGPARELIYTGEMIGADRAKEIGMVNAVFPTEELLEQTRAAARKIAAKGPLAVRAAKEAIRRGLELELEQGCQLESRIFGRIFGPQQKEGMQAFLEKRAPKFQ